MTFIGYSVFGPIWNNNFTNKLFPEKNEVVAQQQISVSVVVTSQALPLHLESKTTSSTQVAERGQCGKAKRKQGTIWPAVFLDLPFFIQLMYFKLSEGRF